MNFTITGPQFKSSALIAVLMLSAACTQVAQETSIELDTDEKRLGYTYGAEIGQQLVNSELINDVDIEGVIAGLREVSTGKDARLTAEEMQEEQTKYQAKKESEFESKADDNKKASDEFMAANAEKAGVVTTESGLQYEMIREGKGNSPTEEDTVKVHYVGKKIDDTVFDSSYDRGSPANFPVSRVIPGFSEGIKLMKEGGKIRLYIPVDQAYGMQAPPDIGPNQALIFEVELIEILDLDAYRQKQEPAAESE